MAPTDIYKKICKAALLKQMFGSDEIDEISATLWTRPADAPALPAEGMILDQAGYTAMLRRSGPNRARSITVKLAHSNAQIASRDALISFTFFDAAGAPLPTPYDGFPESEAIGFYRYLNRVDNQDTLTTTFQFPEGAMFMQAHLKLWKRQETPSYIEPVFQFTSPEFSTIDDSTTLAGTLLEKQDMVSQNYVDSAQNGLSVLKGLRVLSSNAKLEEQFVELATELVDFALQMRFATARGKVNDTVIEQLESFLRTAQTQMNITGAVRSLSNNLRARGDVLTANRLLRQFDPMNPHLTSVGAWARLSERDFDFRPSGKTARKAKLTDPATLRGIYILHNSLPYHSGGYATRAHGMLTGYRNDGVDLIPVLRYGYPVDRLKQAQLKTSYDRDDITYHFAPDFNFNISRLPIDEYIELSARYIEEQAREKQAQFIKAASFFTNGLPAAVAARNLGIPYIYEMRGMAWITKASENPAWENSEECALLIQGEVAAAKQADHVFAITGALRDWLVGQGVDAARISLLPNAIAQGHFKSIPPRDTALAAKLKCENAFVIGYVGSFVEYEGLDLLIDAFEELKARHDVPLKLMLVGDGPYANAIKTKIAKSPVKADIIAPGRVPHEDVSRYYSLINVSVLARKPYAVCEMISPIKPFELFAMGVPILASDVQALAEIVEDGVRGKTFEAGNAQALAQALDDIIQDPSQIKAYTQNARDWVNANRTWDAVTQSAGTNLRSLFK